MFLEWIGLVFYVLLGGLLDEGIRVMSDLSSSIYSQYCFFFNFFRGRVVFIVCSDVRDNKVIPVGSSDCLSVPLESEKFPHYWTLIGVYLVS